jgi:hypothetical protein
MDLKSAVRRPDTGQPRRPDSDESAVEGLAMRVADVAGSAPPLSPAQRERLWLLLHPGNGGGNES